MKSAVVILNPHSGQVDSEALSEDIVHALEDEFEGVVLHSCESSDEARKLAREAREDGADAVFAAGGDGTVSTVVQGILESVDERDSVPILGILPGGTGNGFARTLGIPPTIPEALKRLDFGARRPIDMGFVNGVPFVYTVTGGSLPAGIREVSSEDKTRLGFFSYVASELRRIGDNEQHRLRIVVDGEEVVEDINSFVALSANTLVNFFTASPDTGVEEGKLHLLALKDASLPALLSMVPDVLRRSIEESDHVLYLHGTEIEVECLNGTLRCGVDGDDGPLLPIRLTIQQGRMETFALKEPALKDDV